MPDKPASAKPKVTDDHLKKYEQIMGTSVGSAKPDTAPSSSSGSGIKDSILAAIPKPSGLGNKMFIFTGKKKIIIEGKEMQEEKVKTIDPTPPVKKAPPPPPSATSPPTEAPPAAKVPTVIVKKDNPEKKEGKVEKPTGTRKIPSRLLLVFFLVFMGAWLLFWLVFFGYITI